MAAPLIALLTDFGTDDYFVASLKAVILTINPRARIVDIAHSVPSYDVRAAGFILFACYRYFPAGTVFLAIVDPGVGSPRRILLAETGKYFFIAPDNGLLSLIWDAEKRVRVREARDSRFFLPRPSRTFEGRDKMAPVAAWLSKGARPEEFGPEAGILVKCDLEKSAMQKNGIVGSILYVDKFGNLITNIPSPDLIPVLKKKPCSHFTIFIAGHRRITPFRETFSQGEKGELFFLPGSVGLIEVAAREASAAKMLRGRAGDSVEIRWR
jgi:S-adenosylmethionine hydrolase